ncbi:MAG: hypothetical protein ACJ77D_12240 [Chloroflexota bacterium]
MRSVRRAIEADEALDVTRALALDALRLGRILRDRSRWPRAWSQPAFGIQVERHRRDLARLRTRESLTVGYERDIFLPADIGAHTSEESAIRVAYALRWLELFDDATAPSWPALVG